MTDWFGWELWGSYKGFNNRVLGDGILTEDGSPSRVLIFGTRDHGRLRNRSLEDRQKLVAFRTDIIFEENVHCPNSHGVYTDTLLSSFTPARYTGRTMQPLKDQSHTSHSASSKLLHLNHIQPIHHHHRLHQIPLQIHMPAPHPSASPKRKQ